MTGLLIELKREDNATVFVLSGRLDTLNAPGFAQKVESDLVSSDKVIFDLTNIEYIASSGLREFLTICKKAQTSNTEVVLKGLNSDVKEVFDVTGFSQFFNIED
ncbi:MAG: STAS domain-containing protein [Oscillospiraceae bacterium]|nr:STAS domain-containing protein [Candidatus Ruminococcus equi]